MNKSFNEDFKNDGLVSQLVRRITDLERFEREFRLKKFGAGGGGVQRLTWGVYSAISPLTISGQAPYMATVSQNITLVLWAQTFAVTAPNNAGNYWTIRIGDLNAFATIASFNTSTFSALPVWGQATVNAFVPAALTAADKGLFMDCKKTGAPGSLYVAGPELIIS